MNFSVNAIGISDHKGFFNSEMELRRLKFFLFVTA